MADISAEIAAFQNAVYGEEVRGSMISLAEKLNDVTEDCEDDIAAYTTAITTAISNAESATADAIEATTDANTAATAASTAATSANTAATNATSKANAADALNTSVASAEAARVSAESARATAETARASAETSRQTAETARANAETNRTSNEATRQESESARISSENTRISNEATRQAQETSRQSAETSRVSAESNRSTTFAAMQASFAEMEQQVLPPATYSTLGGVIIDSESGMTVDGNGVLSFTAGDFLTTTDAAATYATITTVNGKANASHNHSASDINDGTLAVNRGGTGVATAAAERERLGLGSTTGALPVANGGTGATTAADARTALSVYSTSEVDTSLSGKAASSHTHAASDVTSGQIAVANGGTGASTVDGARQALNASREWYATSSTAAATAAKTASCTGFVLEAGAAVDVRFTNENTAASPTLNVNSTGAKAIYANNSTTAANCKWMAGETVHFVYDGTYWRMANSVAINSLRESVSNFTQAGDLHTTSYNDMTTPGMYKMSNNASNAPVSNVGFGLFVILVSSENLAQVAFRANGDIWHRAKANGAWSTWSQL
jgi:hypothetical protein